MAATNGHEIPESFTVRLTEQGRHDLSVIAEKFGGKLSDALAHAIGMDAFLIEEATAGTQVILKNNRGTRPLPVLPKRGEDAGRGHGNR